MSLDPRAIAELERLLAEATPGPWCTHPNGTSIWTGDTWDTDDRGQRHLLNTTSVTEEAAANAVLIVEMRNALPDLLAERRELLIKARVAGELVRFRETPDLAKEVDEASDEGLDLDHANLASHYACAIANWNVALDARDEAQKRVLELETERRELLTTIADLHSRIAGDMLALGNDELAEKHEATAAEWRAKAEGKS